MGATTDGELMNSGSTEPERKKPTEETCEFEENNMSFPQDADCDTGIQDQKPADGTGIQPIFPMFNMPQRPTSNALNTDNKEAEEQHRNAWDSALSSSSQEPLPDTMDDTSEPIQGTREVLHTDTPVDLEESVAHPTPTEIMELLDEQKNGVWDAMFETLVKEMQLGDSDMKKQDPPINPDVDLLDEEGYTSLYKAALIGHLEIVDDLISQGANPDKPSKGGLTPLHAAAQEGHGDIVDYLILQGADVNVECEKGRTPLHTAAEKGHANIMDSFFAEGTDVSKKDNTGQTPFLAAVHYGQLKAVNYLIAKGAMQSKFEGMTALYIAAQSGHLEIVKLLIPKGADVNEENDSGQVPLHAAASTGHLDIINFLVDHWADVNKAAMSGWTPFHAAISYGHPDVVEYLTDNLALHTKFDEMTPLYIAARAGHLDVVKFLISQGHDVNELNSSGYSPFHGADIKGHQHVMDYLIRQAEVKRTTEALDRQFYHTELSNSQPEVVKSIFTGGTGNMEKTLLYIAVEYGRLDLVESLIKKGAHVNGTNRNGEVPLHAAARNGNLGITKYLIFHGANVKKKDDVGTTPFLVAIHNGNLEVVKYLKRKGAQDSRVHGMTPLYIAAQSGHLDIVEFLIFQGADVDEENDSGQVPLHGAASGDHLEVVKYLVKHRAHVNKETVTGSTPFFRAVSNGHLEVVEYLRTMGACMTRCLGMTPLYIAAQNGHSEVVKFIIKEGVDVNDGSISGRTPLHAASFTGNLDIVSILVREGANANAKDGDDWTPLHAASQEGHTEIFSYLIKNGADVNFADAEGLTPHLPPSISGDPHKYPKLFGNDTFEKVSQKALKRGSYQDHRDSTKSFETLKCEAVKGGEDQLLGSGVKSQQATDFYFADIVANHSPDISPNADPVKKENGYTAVEKTDTFSSNATTPPDTEVKIKGDRNPFAHAIPKCPINKAPKSAYPEKDNSYAYEQPDTKHESIVLQHVRQYNNVHTTERTAHPDVKRSGYGTQREESIETKEMPPLIELQGITGKLPEDRPSPCTSERRTEPFLEQNSTAGCAPILDTISADSPQDTKKKRRETGARCSPWLALLPSFLQMVAVMAFILIGSPVLVVGGLNTEQVILQAGQPAVIPFDIQLFSNNISIPYFTLRFGSKLRPFCINGEDDIEGFKSLSQFPRFTTSVSKIASSICIRVNINPVDIVDADRYILLAYVHRFETVRPEIAVKEILVETPPGPAKCFITISENNNSPYEVHCQATTGSVETALTCYQHGQRVEVKGDVTDNGQVTKGVFQLPDQSPFSCCSHDVTSEMNVTICDDFEWPPFKKSITHAMNDNDHVNAVTRPAINKISRPDVEHMKNTATPPIESRVESGASRHFMFLSVFTYPLIFLIYFICLS